MDETVLKCNGPPACTQQCRLRVQAALSEQIGLSRAGAIHSKVNGERHYLWRAVDQEGEVLEFFSTKQRDRKAALAFLKRTMKR